MEFERLETALERLIDRHGLDGVMFAIAEVCSGKAGHVASVWRDAELAKSWSRLVGRAHTLATIAKEILP